MMRMVGIDTNILVRYITEDDDKQSKLATKLIEKYSGIRKSIFINNIVICELIWVLIRLYQYNKTQIITLFKEIIATAEFAFENHNLLIATIIEYEESDADFADILIGNINRSNDCTTTLTFDKKAANLESFKIIA